MPYYVNARVPVKCPKCTRPVISVVNLVLTEGPLSLSPKACAHCGTRFKVGGSVHLYVESDEIEEVESEQHFTVGGSVRLHVESDEVEAMENELD